MGDENDFPPLGSDGGGHVAKAKEEEQRAEGVGNEAPATKEKVTPAWQRWLASFIGFVTCGASSFPKEEPSKKPESGSDAHQLAAGSEEKPQPEVSSDGQKETIPAPAPPPKALEAQQVQPTEGQLQNISEACAQLWELDVNRKNPGEHYSINLQEGKNTRQQGDFAKEPLFSFVSDDIFSGPTYSHFRSLMDNFNPDASVQEEETEEKRAEERAFIEEICKTPVLNYVFNYLCAKQLFQGDYSSFKASLGQLWFKKYGRGGGHKSSCAFEHVFVGEVKEKQEEGAAAGEKEVTGFHNWLTILVEEQKGALDYFGYIRPRGPNRVQPSSSSRLLTIQFEWNGLSKRMSSMMMGVSPEFELAVYTLCFYEGQERTQVQLGDDMATVVVYHLGSDKIGSAFVEDND